SLAWRSRSAGRASATSRLTTIFSPEDGAPLPHLPPSVRKGRSRLWTTYFCSSDLAYNSGMNEKELAAQLRREGFTRTYVWEDSPNAQYPDHTHPTETAHILLSGEMTLTTSSGTASYHAGDRCDVPAQALHSARIGPHGCRYLIGER